MANIDISYLDALSNIKVKIPKYGIEYLASLIDLVLEDMVKNVDFAGNIIFLV